MVCSFPMINMETIILLCFKESLLHDIHSMGLRENRSKRVSRKFKNVSAMAL